MIKLIRGSLIFIALIYTSTLFAMLQDKPLVHIKPGSVYSMKFDPKQNKHIEDWLKNTLPSSSNLPKKLAWMQKHRSGNYSDKLFFKHNAAYLTMRLLGTVKHLKSGSQLAVVIVLPSDNTNLSEKFRPTKSFVLLVKPTAITQGKAPNRVGSDRAKKLALEIQKDWSGQKQSEKKKVFEKVLSSSRKAECISGNCKSGKGTFKFSDDVLLKGNFDGTNNYAKFEFVYPKDTKGASRFIGTIDPVLLHKTKGTLYYDKIDMALSANFNNDHPNGSWTMKFGNNVTIRGEASDKLGFHGKVTAYYTKVPYSMPFQLGELQLTGQFKNSNPIGLHQLYWCENCSPSFTYNMNKEDGGIMALYAKGSYLGQLYKDAQDLYKFKTDLKKELKKRNIPLVGEFNLTCGNSCEGAGMIPILYGNDIRVFISAPVTEGRFKVRIPGVGEQECKVEKNICVALFEKSGKKSMHSIYVTKLSPSIGKAYITNVLVAGHKK